MAGGVGWKLDGSEVFASLCRDYGSTVLPLLSWFSSLPCSTCCFTVSTARFPLSDLIWSLRGTERMASRLDFGCWRLGYDESIISRFLLLDLLYQT